MNDLNHLLAQVRQAGVLAKLSAHTLLAYGQTWRRLLAWCGARGFDPAALSLAQAAEFQREVTAAGGQASVSSQRVASTALGFAYRAWDTPNPFVSLRPPGAAPPAPAARFPAHDLARLLEFLSTRRRTYGQCLAYHLAATLFHTAAKYSQVASLRWSDCVLDGGGRPVALRLQARGAPYPPLPVSAALAAILVDWRVIQSHCRGVKVFAVRGLTFCRSEFIFAGPGGAPYTNHAFNAQLKSACQAIRLPVVLSAQGLRDNAAMFLLHAQGKSASEVQGLLRCRDRRSLRRYA